MVENQEGPRSLPVYRHQEEIIAAVAAHRVVVIEGPTGSGKTTQIPQILLKAGLSTGMIGVTQPRRIAAVSVARRIAEEMGVRLGEAVGYAIRFEDVTGPRTLLKIMTDGILLQEARSDPDFSSYGLLMIDEAHERSLNIDLCLGLLYQVLKRRHDLRIVVSSATLKPEEFQEFFFGAAGDVARISIQGRPFPIQVRYLPPLSRRRLDLADAVADQVAALHRGGEPGHILTFLTGEEMIEKTARSLASICPDKSLVVVPVFGRMKREEQDRVFDPVPGRRKAVLATNIAETSITIPDVRYVVDTGLVKLPRYNSLTGISAIQEEPISRASAEQRAGRAGRTGPGKVIRLYERAELARQPQYTDEEIRRLDLSEVILRLVDLGIQEVESFPFPSPPSRRMIRAALLNLQTLGAIDRHRQLTEIGRRMVPFPLSPFLARMVVEAADRFEDVVEEVLVLGAFLSVRTPMLFPMGEEAQARDALAALAHPLGDAATAVQTFMRWARALDRSAFCQQHYLDPDIMAFIEKARDQLAELAIKGGIEVKRGGDMTGVIRCLAAACPDKVLKREGRPGSYVTPLGVKLAIHPSSVLFGSRYPFLVAAELVLSTRTFARQVSVLQPEWLKEVNPQAAARWNIRGRTTSRRKQARIQVAQLPERIEVGPVFLRISRHRERFQVEIGLDQVAQLRRVSPEQIAPEHAGWQAVVETPLGKLGRGTTLSRLVAMLPSMTLPGDPAPLTPGPGKDSLLLQDQPAEPWNAPEGDRSGREEAVVAPAEPARIVPDGGLPSRAWPLAEQAEAPPSEAAGGRPSHARPPAEQGKAPPDEIVEGTPSRSRPSPEQAEAARSIPEGDLLDAGEDWPIIERHLGLLLTPMIPAHGRQPGWLALLANGMGEYWYEVMRDYPSALSATVLSLEDLIGCPSTAESSAARAHPLLERLAGLLERLEEALERVKLGRESS
ncbi:MAG: DEAD/DEAH box helicase [Bradymonadales bacterium]|nr:DEAD/DEAH box helicase [Bradymonadales bacterium]